MQTEKKFCPAVWLSGFFALGFLVHIVRTIFQVPVAVNGRDIPLSLSAALAVAFGLLSLGALWIGLKKPCCEGKSDGDEKKDGTSTCCGDQSADKH